MPEPATAAPSAAVPAAELPASLRDAALGFDGSPVAHMWRTMIWPNNFL
jgi:hypothetical protein